VKGGYNWVINQLITGGHHPVAPLRYYPGLTPYKVFHNDSPDVSQASLGPMSLVQACAGMVNAIAFETSETLVSHVTGAVSKVGTAKIQLRRWGRKLHSCLMFARGCGHCHRDLWWLMFRREKTKKWCSWDFARCPLKLQTPWVIMSCLGVTIVGGHPPFWSLQVKPSSWGGFAFTRPGKHTKNYGKSPCLMGKSTINGHVQ